jgi:hypothetical protein
MKIISTFKDYYDSAISFASLVYDRKTVIRPIKETRGNTVEPKYPHIRWLYGTQSEALIIGFCGKLYPCIKVVDQFYYDASQIPQEDLKGSFRVWIDRNARHEFWTNTTDLTKHAESLFLDTPVFVYTHTVDGKQITLNPCLKEFQFYKVVDPVTACQEISMHLGTYLSRNEISSQPLSEKEALQKHGMDKWSFKKKK